MNLIWFELRVIALSICSNSAENWEVECDVKVSPKVSGAVNHWGRQATEKKDVQMGGMCPTVCEHFLGFIGKLI